MEEVDCAVIGTGFYGLGAAKQYHAFNKQSSLVVFEKNASIGGTWVDHRIYPGLKSNNLIGSYEYPDYPMRPQTYGLEQKQHIPGAVVNQYLKDYARDNGITELIRFNSEVTTARHGETDQGGWELTVVNSAAKTESKVFARRLIVACGHTSDPWLPHFAGQESFGGEIFHGIDFLQNAHTIVEGNTVTVFGASKLAWDAVYVYAKAGAKVHWVIRASGHGPCWMAPPFVTPLKRWIEGLANTRALTWFSPCVWGHADGFARIRDFLHGTGIGRTIVDAFWKILSGDVLRLNNYDAHPDTQKLKPWTEAMFAGPSFSILNYDTSIWDLIKSDLVDIHVGEITHLSPGTVHLGDGSELESNALLAHTGWKNVPSIKFLPEGIERELGLPHVPSNIEDDRDVFSRSMTARADVEIFDRFPRLRNQPVWNKNYIPMTDQKGIDSNDEVTPYKSLAPWTLYRFMIPASERLLKTRDIAFVGASINFSNVITAHIQGLWIHAYFNGLLANDPAAAVGDPEAVTRLQYQTVLYNRYGKWRYPTDWGTNKVPGFVFDAVPYLDLLQKDLGLKVYRKGWFLAEWLSAYLPPDYRGINSEWEQLQKVK